MSFDSSAARFSILCGVLYGLLYMSGAAAADRPGADREEDERQESGSHWGLGLGASTGRSPYIGVKNRNTALPLITFENQYVRFFGNTLDAKLPSAGQFDFSLRTKIAFGEGYKASDSDSLAGLDTRRGGIYLGAATTWRSPWAKVSVELLTDASGHSKGSTLKLDIERSFGFARQFQLTPHASVEMQNKKYIDYYYGVKATEARSTRPEYLGKSNTDVEIGLRVGYMIDEHQNVLLDITETRWGSGIKNSPIVDKTSTPGLKAFYLYRF